ncbi:MAG TPA: inorganic diphosphatase [Bryobacteraceae bacterium]|jgi:inorganic pyrophosphatase|nr:inorganic diphosphatase [Bryobacteraceae bacterium]
MPHKLSDLDPGAHCPDTVRMIVEIPKNSANKYEYDVKLGIFRLDRTLYSSVHYPADYGFIPGTVAEDGDPMDILALADEPAFPGCMIEVRPVGILEMEDDKGTDRKIFAVPLRNPRYDQIRGRDDVPGHVILEIENFFSIYKQLEGKSVRVHGWRGREAACAAIRQTRDRYLADKKPRL